MKDTAYINHIQRRIKDLTRIDTKRLYQVIEILQYSILYAFVAGLAGICLEKIFPSPDEKKKTHIILLEVLLQCMLSALSVFYLRKLVKIVPFIFEGNEYYTSHKTEEYNGEIMIAIVFVGIQKNLITKIDILRGRFL